MDSDADRAALMLDLDTRSKLTGMRLVPAETPHPRTATPCAGEQTADLSQAARAAAPTASLTSAQRSAQMDRTIAQVAALTTQTNLNTGALNLFSMATPAM